MEIFSIDSLNKSCSILKNNSRRRLFLVFSEIILQIYFHKGKNDPLPSLKLTVITISRVPTGRTNGVVEEKRSNVELLDVILFIFNVIAKKQIQKVNIPQNTTQKVES